MSVSVPVETVDDILSHIEEPSDLIPSLLVSKTFNALTGRHIQYRVIRCPLGLTQLWERLSENPSLAENVRVLEVQREEEGFLFKKLAPATVPREFEAAAQTLYGDGHPYLSLDPSLLPSLRDAEILLVSAVKNMTRLKSFTWEREPPMLDSRVDPFPPDLWSVLRHHKVLVSVTVLDSTTENYKQYNPQSCAHLRSIHNSLIFTLSNLTKFEYETSAYLNSLEIVPVDSMFTMLMHCPNLETIKVIFKLFRRHRREANLTSVDFSGLFETIHWKALNAINLSGVHVSSSAAIRFLHAHSTIQRLHILGPNPIIGADSTQFQLPPQVLPTILDLYVPTYLTVLILNGLISHPRPLRKLQLSPYVDPMPPFFSKELLHVFECHPTIEELQIPLVQPQDLMELSRVLPRIKILGFFLSLYYAEEASDEWIAGLLLIPFPNLEALTGITMFTTTQSSAVRDSVVSRLVSHFPCLRKIQEQRVARPVGVQPYADIFLRNAAGELIWKFSTDRWDSAIL